MRKILLGLAAAALVSSSFAAGGDPSEKGVPKSSLKIYSGGVALGAMVPVSEKFQEDCGDVFLGVSFINSWQFRDNVALFADASWFAPGSNFGLDAGVDYLFSTSSVRPFAGAGIGGHYFYRDGDDVKFGEKFGPSLTAHIGVALDVTETVQVRLRAPYRFTLTKTRDQGFGVDLGVVFSSKFSKIKKLNY
jgi:hypothetical protein